MTVSSKLLSHNGNHYLPEMVTRGRWPWGRLARPCCGLARGGRCIACSEIGTKRDFVPAAGLPLLQIPHFSHVRCHLSPKKVLAELKMQRLRIDYAIAVLERIRECEAKKECEGATPSRQPARGRRYGSG